ncbi:DUF5990 family protein [Streptomyces sp. NPDC058289]|uniref:DUF5990 family protein n=1 Tax=Streptomyces sp. NPDC058289 TaxID=3346425 RepID=UPI0036EBEF9C
MVSAGQPMCAACVRRVPPGRPSASCRTPVEAGRIAPKGVRGPFVYLTWGELPAGGAFTMFRRAELMLDDLPLQAVERGAAESRLGRTDACGMPVCAAVRPPALTWS